MFDSCILLTAFIPDVNECTDGQNVSVLRFQLPNKINVFIDASSKEQETIANIWPLYFVSSIPDINECTEEGGILNKCSFPDTCINIIGGYTCSCPTGYYLSSDQRNCIGK